MDSLSGPALVVGSAARLATSIASDAVVREEDLFYLSAAVVEAAHSRDTRALRAAVDCTSELISITPASAAAQLALTVLRQISWLLLRRQTAAQQPAAAPPTRPPSP